MEDDIAHLFMIVPKGYWSVSQLRHELAFKPLWKWRGQSPSPDHSYLQLAWNSSSSSFTNRYEASLSSDRPHLARSSRGRDALDLSLYRSVIPSYVWWVPCSPMSWADKLIAWKGGHLAIAFHILWGSFACRLGIYRWKEISRKMSI